MILCPVKNPSIWRKPRVSQGFGVNKQVYSQFGNTGGHSGIDIAIPTGTLLYAPFDGKVSIQMFHKNYGHNIRIKNDRLEAILAHCSSFICKDGESVPMGAPIALSGGDPSQPGAGFSSGPHLHFAVRHIDPKGIPLNPDNGDYGWEDLFKYTICWYHTLTN